VTRVGEGIIIATRGCSNDSWSSGGISVGGGIIVPGGLGALEIEGLIYHVLWG
jgi:hypothetical protein